MHTPNFCADKYVLIDLNDLIGVGYDLSDTKDGLKVLEKWDLNFVVNILSS